MSFKDKKPGALPVGWTEKLHYSKSDMDEYLAIVEPKAEAFDELTTSMAEDLQLTPEDFLERKKKAGAFDELRIWINDYPRKEQASDVSDYIERLDRWWKRGVVILEAS